MPTVTPMFIDMLTLVLDMDEDGGLAEYIASWSEGSELRIRSSGWEAGRRRYNRGWRLTIPGSLHPTSVLLLMQPKQGTRQPFLSVEFNPRKVGADAMLTLWEALGLILGEAFDSLVHNAAITRIDFSVDVYPLSCDSIFVAGKGLSRGQLFTGSHGRVESIGLGSRSSQRSFRIYQRDHETRERVSRRSHVTRIEGRVKPCYRERNRIGLSELLDGFIDNPFSSLKVVCSIDPSALDSARYVYRLFLDSAWRRGLQGALGQIKRPETKAQFLNFLDSHMQTGWFDPEDIWSEYRNAVSVLRLEHLLRPHSFGVAVPSDEVLYIQRRRRVSEW